MVIWVCEASEVNNLTVLAVWPNHRDKDKDKDKDKDDNDKIASSRSDPPKGSDKNISMKDYMTNQNLCKTSKAKTKSSMSLNGSCKSAKSESFML